MRILGITQTCDLGSLYLRLIGDGHEVKVTVSEPLAHGTMAGLVPRVSCWHTELEWIRSAGPDGLIVFEAVGFGELQDQLRRDGFNVIGGSSIGDRLENDRGFALNLLSKRGLNIAPVREYGTVVMPSTTWPRIRADACSSSAIRPARPSSAHLRTDRCGCAPARARRPNTAGDSS